MFSGERVVFGLQDITLCPNGGTIAGRVVPMIKIGNQLIVLTINGVPLLYKPDIMEDKLVVHDHRFDQKDEELISRAQEFVFGP